MSGITDESVTITTIQDVASTTLMYSLDHGRRLAIGRILEDARQGSLGFLIDFLISLPQGNEATLLRSIVGPERAEFALAVEVTLATTSAEFVGAKAISVSPSSISVGGIQKLDLETTPVGLAGIVMGGALLSVGVILSFWRLQRQKATKLRRGRRLSPAAAIEPAQRPRRTIDLDAPATIEV